jgi:Clp amino terminal domain, pathogenicity island component/UvrB/uvrC motif
VGDRLAARGRPRPDPSSAAVASYAAFELFERFTERARQVVVLAQDEARALKHNYIGTEHLLLGLLREEEGVAARVLEGLDVSLEEVRAQVARIIGEGDEVASGQIPFTPRAKKVLELSLREALGLGHNYIGTEHILLGLAREGEGVAMRILVDYDVDAMKVRDGVVRALSGAHTPVDPVAEVDPELRTEVERVRAEKAEAVAAKEFERAASLRMRERNLVRLARAGDAEGFWEEAKSPLPEARLVSMRVPPRRTRILGGSTTLASSAAVAEHRMPAVFLAGGATFGVALGVGILLGRLIWG